MIVSCRLVADWIVSLLYAIARKIIFLDNSIQQFLLNYNIIPTFLAPLCPQVSRCASCSSHQIDSFEKNVW